MNDLLVERRRGHEEKTPGIIAFPLWLILVVAGMAGLVYLIQNISLIYTVVAIVITMILLFILAGLRESNLRNQDRGTF